MSGFCESGHIFTVITKNAYIHSYVPTACELLKPELLQELIHQRQKAKQEFDRLISAKELLALAEGQAVQIQPVSTRSNGGRAQSKVASI